MDTYVGLGLTLEAKRRATSKSLIVTSLNSIQIPMNNCSVYVNPLFKQVMMSALYDIILKNS